jgi:CelD/BcsL family acetyltransferase involved in cellulose biosynthesis
MASEPIGTRVLDSFYDTALGARTWNTLLSAGDTDTVFLTWEWQKAWWDIFGRGKLLLIVAERASQAVALAPLFLDGGMLFFIGSGGSDYLDFVGNVGEPGLLARLLETARQNAPGAVGFRFYHVPDSSHTGECLQAAAASLGLTCFDEGELPAPALDLRPDPAVAAAAASKKSLLRHERVLQRQGQLEVHHFQNASDILPALPILFEQHISRWAGTDSPSLFIHPAQRRFYERLTQTGSKVGWLRFTRLDWNGRPIACHFGFCHRGNFMWYKPSFEVALARRSPGEVLLRRLLLAAIDEGAHTFDFGLGDEAFKQRFATRINRVRTWGLYPQRNT